MDCARYFVFPSNAEWLVSIDGTLIGRHRTRPEALRSAIVMADLMGSMQHDADVMIEDEGELRPRLALRHRPAAGGIWRIHMTILAAAARFVTTA